MYRSPTSPATTSFWFVLLFWSCVITTDTKDGSNGFVSAYADHRHPIRPGIGLCSTTSDMKIVIFEHTRMGTGGLVLNCPTPLNIGQLSIPRFQHFRDCSLMLGCGVETSFLVDDEDFDDDIDEEEDTANPIDEIPLGQVSPWFWLHDMEDIPGSFALEGAAGPLFMGGSIDFATQQLVKEEINPVGRFKFFRKYKQWAPGELQKEIQRGEWKTTEQDPSVALENIRLSIRLPGL